MAYQSNTGLKGKETRDFSARINSNKDRPVSKEASERAVKVYKEMLKVGTYTFEPIEAFNLLITLAFTERVS